MLRHLWKVMLPKNLFASPLAGIALAVFVVVTTAMAQPAHAATVYVDTAGSCGGQTPCYTTIQAGISAASAGDTVQVAAGTYNENISLRSGVVVQGAGPALTIIDGTGNSPVVTAVNADSTAVIDGFTITGGTGNTDTDDGGGFWMWYSSAKLVNLIIAGNSSERRGGVHIVGGAPTITDTKIFDNSSISGAGIKSTDSELTIINTVITSNTAAYSAVGGVSIDGGKCSIRNSIITSNYGDGLNLRTNALVDVYNSVISYNTRIGVYNFGGTINVTNTVVSSNLEGGFYNYNAIVISNYNDVWNNSGLGNYWAVSAGQHDVSADPSFVDALTGNYHLRLDSPCIDAGNNAAVPSTLTTDLYGNSRIIDGNRDGVVTVDIGAAEFLPLVGTTTHFTVSRPTSTTAGDSFNFAVTAKDDIDGTITNYTGTVHFTSSDPNATLPADATLANGVGTFSATLKTVGNQAITATDIANSSITGTSTTITVNPAPATHFSISAPSSATAGSAFSFTVTALDANNNTATAYTGTTQFSSSDSNALLPANTTLTNGVGSFSATLKTAGSHAITATDTVTTTITGTSNPIEVSAGAATHFTVSAPASATAGTTIGFTVTAFDENNNTKTDYAGTVHFTSSDSKAVVPENATLNNGVGNFSATLRTAGSQTITATDTDNTSITGAANAIQVLPAAATHFSVSAPELATAGSSLSFTVTALDADNNTATGYSGTAHFTSTDSAATLPADAKLTEGVGSFSATLKTAGSHTITATDTATASITGTSGLIAVRAGEHTHFSVSAPTSATAGTAFDFTVTALDANSNPITAYSGKIHFTSSDANASLPADLTLTSGVGTFSAAMKTAGSQTITATDTINPTISGASNGIEVAAGAATHFTLSAPSSATAGTAFEYTVTALDIGNNTATVYTGTVHFSSSDGSATLPTNSTLTSGVGTFSATLTMLGNQTITATDSTNTSVTGTSNAITVNAAPATQFAVSAPAFATVGSALTFTVTALDTNNHTATGYTGTIHFTSSDTSAVLPANSNVVNGVGTFTATLNTTGNQTVTATDIASSSISGTSNVIAVASSTGPDLTIFKTHKGNFLQGQVGATYTITVRNAGTGPATGMVTVTDTPDAGLTVTALRGSGWACAVRNLTCTRNKTLTAGSNFPPITVTVKVDGDAPALLTNTAIVSGGGDTNTSNNTAIDATTISAAVPDLTINKSHNGNFKQGQIGATYTITVSNSGTAPTTGAIVTATDNVPTGLTPTAITGSGWNCDPIVQGVSSLSCTRSSVLSAGTSYPPITVRVNVANPAPSFVTNTATVSGGGELNTSNDTATDPTMILRK